MKIISHRGNVFGPNLETENDPFFIKECIKNYNLDVEIDIWKSDKDSDFSLGHDYGKYPINLDWLLSNSNKLWIHCKDLSSFSILSSFKNLNVFWHEEDTYTLTSKGYIWAYPRVDINEKTIVVNLDKKIDSRYTRYPFGICTDYPLNYI